MKIWKVLFTLSKKEQLRAVRSTRQRNSFSKLKVKTLPFRTLEITFGKDTYPNRYGEKLSLRSAESLPLLECLLCRNMTSCLFPEVLQPSRAEEVRAGNRNNPLPPCTQLCPQQLGVQVVGDTSAD